MGVVPLVAVALDGTACHVSRQYVGREEARSVVSAQLLRESTGGILVADSKVSSGDLVKTLLQAAKGTRGEGRQFQPAAGVRARKLTPVRVGLRRQPLQFTKADIKQIRDALNEDKEVDEFVNAAKAMSKEAAEQQLDDDIFKLRMVRWVVRNVPRKKAFWAGLALNSWCLTGYVGWGVAAAGTATGHLHVAAAGASYATGMSVASPFLHIAGSVMMAYGAPEFPEVNAWLKRKAPEFMREYNELIFRVTAEQ